MSVLRSAAAGVVDFPEAFDVLITGEEPPRVINRYLDCALRAPLDMTVRGRTSLDMTDF